MILFPEQAGEPCVRHQDLLVGKNDMVAGIIIHKHHRDRTFHVIRSNNQPVDLGPCLIRTEPHPHLPPGPLTMERRSLLDGLKEYPVALRRQNSVHLMLEHVQNLRPALLPLTLLHLFTIREHQWILKGVRGHGGLIIIHTLRRCGDSQKEGCRHQKEKPVFCHIVICVYN